MSRTTAIVALTTLIVIFVLNVLDYLAYPFTGVVPPELFKLTSAILIGVVIALIAGAFRNGGSSTTHRGEHDESERHGERHGDDRHEHDHGDS